MIKLEILSKYLDTPSLKKDGVLQYFEVIGSTNHYLYEKTLVDKSSPQVVIAAHQTQGKGRLNRSWLDHPNQALLFSCFYCFSDAKRILPLPLIIGIALAEVLSQYNPAIGLKWPNDLVLDGKKLGGILIETRFTSRCEAIIGVGINLYPADFQSSEIAFCALAEASLLHVEPNQLLAALLDNLFKKLIAFETNALSWEMIFKKYDTLKDKCINVQNAEGIYQGIARGVDAEGALLVETDAGIKRELQATVRQI